MTEHNSVLRSVQDVNSQSNPADASERRKNRRFGVSASADIAELRTHARLTGRVSDLGPGGCYIDTVSPFPPGTALMIKLVSGHRAVVAKAAVIYAQTGMGMGLVFTELDATEKKKLDTWLQELGGEPLQEVASAPGEIMKKSESLAIPKWTGVRDALQDLVSLLRNKGMLTEAEIEVLRAKMGK